MTLEQAERLIAALRLISLSLSFIFAALAMISLALWRRQP